MLKWTLAAIAISMITAVTAAMVVVVLPRRSAVKPVSNRPTRSSATRRRVVSVGVIALAASLGFGVFMGLALAVFNNSNASAANSITADAMSPGSTPTVVVSGTQVTISWAQTKTVSGRAIQGYTVVRYAGPSGGAATAAANGCANTIVALTCTETGVPAGTWYYAVTPWLQGWSGAESSRTGVTIVGSAFNVSTAAIHSGGTLAATLSTFQPNENVAFYLDSVTGPLLSSTTTHVDPSGQATVSITGVSGSEDAHTVVAVGDAGSQATSNPFTIDDTNPTAVVTFPANGSATTSTYNQGCSTPAGDICGTATDSGATASGVQSVALTIQRSDGAYWGGSSWQASPATVAAVGTSSWSYGFSQTADDTYTVVATATDAATNAGTSSAVSYRIDNTPPTVSVTSPANNATVTTATPTISGAGGTATGDLSAITVRIYNSSNTLLQTLGASGASWSATPAALGAGTYTVTASQADSAGNTGASSTVTFTVSFDPIVSITFPGTGGYYDDAYWNGSTSNPCGAKTVCGTTSSPVSATISGVTISISDDTAGLCWDGGKNFNKSCPWDNSATGTSSYSRTLDAANLTDGHRYTMTASATDGTRTGVATSSFVFDKTNPSIAAAAIGPIGNTTTPGYVKPGGQYYVYANVTDAIGVASATANMNAVTSGQTAVALTAGSYSAFGATYNYRSAPITADADVTAGNKTYTITATDLAGNTLPPANQTAKVDTAAPSGSITVPANGAYVSSPVTITSNSADASGTVSGVYSAEFQYTSHGAGNWLTAGTATTSPYSVSWSTLPLQEGQYDLRVITTDNAGNASISSLITVNVDRTPPSAPSAPDLESASDTGVSSTDDLTKDNTPTFTGSAEAGATVKIFDGPTQVGSGIATGAGTYSVTASSLADGSHTISSTATDAAGNASGSSGTLTVVIDATAPAITDVVLAPVGTANQLAEANETATVTFSEPLDAALLCSAWNNSGVQQLTNATVTIADSAGSDPMTATSSSCASGGHFGAVIPGDYVGGGSTTFTNSTITWDPSARTLTIKLGAIGTNKDSTHGAKAPKYTADAAAADLAGNPAVTTTFTDSTTTGW